MFLVAVVVSAPSAGIERALVGSCLIDSEAIKAVRSLVTPDDFASPTCRLVYEAMLALDGRLIVVDWATVRHEIERAGAVGAIGGVATLTALINCAPCSLYAGHYAELVAEAAAVRRTGMSSDERQQAVPPGLTGISL